MLVVLPFVVWMNPAQTADHRDAPAIAEDGRADILDVYAFVNGNNGNVVLAMTVNPFVIGGALQVAFSPDVLYQFKIDNTGDSKEDLVIQALFTPTVPGPQMVTILGPDNPPRRFRGAINQVLSRNNTPTFSGPANGTVINGTNGMRAFGGLRDDPFFIDLIWVLRLLGLQPGGPLTRANGIDFFDGLNCSCLAVEVPPTLLRGSTGDVIRVWATTSRPQQTIRRPDRSDLNSTPFVQIDRTGLPVINTVLIPSALKDAFNRGVPEDDRSQFRQTAINTLTAVNGNAAYSAAVADVLLPDVLTLNMTNTAGFLNGRRPEDDVIDIVLSVASNGAVTTDGVGANDVSFLTDFPFFAPPHGPEELIPPRN